MKKLSNPEYKKVNEPINFYLCHGFAMDSSYFASLIVHLQEVFPNSKIYNFDLGFFGNPTKSFPSFRKGVNIAIGHSFGVAHLYGLRKQLKLALLVSLSGFLQFVFDFNKEYFDKFEAGISKYPKKTLNLFYREAGIIPPFGFPDRLDTAFLNATLTTMKNLSVPPECDIPIISMISVDDTIVPRQLTEANFGKSNFISSPTPIKHSLGENEIPFIIYELYKILSLASLELLLAEIDA